MLRGVGDRCLDFRLFRLRSLWTTSFAFLTNNRSSRILVGRGFRCWLRSRLSSRLLLLRL